jgi:hypothetical protein
MVKEYIRNFLKFYLKKEDSGAAAGGTTSSPGVVTSTSSGIAAEVPEHQLGKPVQPITPPHIEKK